MKFRATDESVSKIIDYLKEIVEAGDNLYKKKDYSESRGKCRDVIYKINTKIAASKRKKIRSFIENIHKRIASTYNNEFKIKIY